MDTSPLNSAQDQAIPSAAPPSGTVEMWGGIECSVTRVQDQLSDQLKRAGHFTRNGDLDLLRSLGLRAIRYPVLWEHFAQGARWDPAESRLNQLLAEGIQPIVGLVHHGSGPIGTSLLEESFVTGLAAHAAEVAGRNPGVSMYTPVNEPLTTARFSGLYGHWYPHRRDNQAFVRALLTECKATRESMKAVRRIRPDARLVQTEDIGHTYGTPPLQYQVDFDNGRRWLSLDLLMGMVDRNHQFWSYLLEHGASEDELVSFLEEPCRPDIIGANYYVTSERFLDHRIDRYPAGVVGGNGHQQYADVCAVRVRKKGIAGAYGILRQVWDRYRREVAMTECHLGCTRDEQIRWLLEAWNAAHCLARENIPVRAVTAWSLFGAYDWDSLLTRFTGNYEPGAFDLRAPKPRPTALAQCVRELATNGRFLHPLLASPGWWRRSQRVLYPVVQERARNHAPVFESTQSQPAPPLLITGASGTLGRAFARICEVRGLAFQLLSRQQMDIADPHSVEEAIRQLRPWAVINAAGYVKVDQAEEQPEACFRENALGPAILARFCHKAGARLVTFSSDLVFDGRRDKPYLESTATNPLNVYGQSKVEAERAVLEASDRALIVRTSAFFGPWDDYNFVCHVREKLRRGETVVAADDVIISPTYVPDLVNNTLDLLIDGETGIWHLANAGGLSWAEWAGLVTDAYGAPRSLVEPVNRDRLSLAAARPAYSVIGSERGWIMPAFTSAMERFVGERQEYENKVQVSPQCGDQRGSRVDRKASRRAA